MSRHGRARGARPALDVVPDRRARARSAACEGRAVRLGGHVDRPRSRPLRPAARAACGRDDVVDAGPSGPRRRDGAFSVPFKAAVPAAFRVVGGGLTTPETSLAVAPAVALKVAADYSGLAGTIKPKLPGTSVQIQQADEATGGWSTLARTTASTLGTVRRAVRRHARDLPRPRRRGPRLGGCGVAESRRRLIRAAAVAAAGALLWAAHAHAARFAVGVDPRPRCRAPPGSWPSSGRWTAASRRSACWSSSSPRARGVRRIDGVRWVEWLGSHRRLAFTPTDPLVAQAVVPPAGSRVRLLAGARPCCPPVKVAVDRLGHRRDAPRPREPDPPRAHLRRRLGRGLGRARDVRRRRDRRRDEQLRGHRRHRRSRRNCSSRRSYAPTARSRSRPRRRRSAGPRTRAPA